MRTILDRLLDLLKDSTITQTILVLLIFGPIAYQVTIRGTIPEQLIIWGSVIIGFFFGAKAAYLMIKGAGK